MKREQNSNEKYDGEVLINVELDAKRFAWLIENILEYKPANYDGLDFGRFDMFWRSDIEDIRAAIDKEIKKPIHLKYQEIKNA